MASRFIEQNISGAKKAGATLGLGGAYVTDAANEALNYFTGIEKAPSAVKTMQPVFNRAWGIESPKAPSMPPPNKRIMLPPPEETLPEGYPKGIAPAATPAKATPFDLAKSHNGDIYAALRDPGVLSDKQFKKFVEVHGESLPGIGFVEDANTGKITRVASRPATPEMNVTQANTMANMITAQSHAKSAEAQAANAKLGIDERKDWNAEKIEQKKVEDFYKVHGRPIYNIEGKQEGYNPELTIWDAFHAGGEEIIPKSELPMLKKVGQKWQDFFHTSLTNKAWMDAYRKNKPATEKALMNSFRNYLNSSYQSNLQ